MSIKRYSPRSVRDCDGDWFSTGNEEKPDGIYVLHSDYAAILARHNALVEAVAWLRECEDCDQWAFEEFWVYDYELAEICAAARAEVDRLIGESEGEG